MHGRIDEESKKGRHMWTEPTLGNSVVGAVAAASADVSSSNSLVPSDDNSFFKDGRKISVGDCALFKPPKDSPPFIGIIRWLATSKENQLNLCVNWLYRPPEVKLGKGISLEAAPNEVFYSFHKDEIPAASLLHPCKVAFLPKGVELPSGISSFVCWRVYDITNKCLWWLTDQDYINERQEEVDQLLCRTRIEMNTTVQPGGRSPKQMNGPTSSSNLKPVSDSLHNSASSFTSQVKGKKRERADQGSEPVKRERSLKMNDGDFGQSKTESTWRSEISKFTEKGGLVDSEGVEKFVQLMLPERNEKKIDLVGRSVLASVVAATDKVDCLARFVQLRGLSVFDEWLQEFHKGKVGDGSGPRDGDKSIEEFLLVLLRALDKLPVNLHALQMCNIGKSVNHLRTHKNLEIQKKARSLVDTWKKRVEAEMDFGSNQAVSWASRPRLPEVSHGGSRHSGTSSEVAVKSSAGQIYASKNTSFKVIQGDTASKSASASASPSSIKSAPSASSVGNALKDGLPRNTSINGGSDSPLAVTGDEKSSSSSQSHNNSHSCSSDHAKTGGYSGKEDARSSTAISVTANKVVGGSSRHRRTNNGLPGPTSGARKESGSSRNSSSPRNPGSEKLPQSTLTREKAIDAPVAEGNNHKLIVKLSNKVRSPSRSGSGGSFEDHTVMNSRASSPMLSEKCDMDEKNDAYQAKVICDVNNESWQSNDFKEVLTGSDEGDGSPGNLPDEDNSRTGDDSGKMGEISKAASSSSGIECKSGKLHEPSFSSINALVESCVKYSEENALISVGDNLGMNLLASVAAGEMSRSDKSSPSLSPLRIVNFRENSCSSDLRMKSSTVDSLAKDRAPFDDDEHEKEPTVLSESLEENTQDKTLFMCQEQPTGELNGNLKSSGMDEQQVAEACVESNVKSEKASLCTSLAFSSFDMVEKTSDGGGTETWNEKSCEKLNACGIPDAKEDICNFFQNEEKVNSLGVLGTKAAVQSPLPSLDVDSDKKLKVPVHAEQKPASVTPSGCTNGMEILQPFDSAKNIVQENIDVVKGENTVKTEGDSQSPGKHKNDKESNFDLAKNDCIEHVECSQIKEQPVACPMPSHNVLPAVVQESEQQEMSNGLKQEIPERLKLAGNKPDEAECTSATEEPSAPSAAIESDIEAKVEFDLNEGLNGDDAKFGELDNLRSPEHTTGVQSISPLSLPVSSASSGPASITVASAAKRPFVPPEDLLKIRGELGWKGSAATSAFRPAEPRKSLETPVSNASFFLSDGPAAKPSRPLLDIDLNVPDERTEDMSCQSAAPGSCLIPELVNGRGLLHDETRGSESGSYVGGLGLDLNKVDEPADLGNHLTSNSCMLDVHPAKSSSGGVHSICRDFDLNGGPLDEVNRELSSFGQHTRNSVPSHSHLPVSSLQINNADMGNFSSWFSPMPAVAIQPIVPEKGEQSFPVVGPSGPQRLLTPASTLFSPDIYRGSVLSSSAAVPFTSAPFQYPVYPFGTSYPLPSATFSVGSTTYMDSSAGSRLCFPHMTSQVLAPAGAVQSHYSRPFSVSLIDSNNGIAASSRKWGKQGLDLNAGPLGPDIEGRDEMPFHASRQLSIANSQALAQEQSRIYQVGGGSVLKRKEPDGGWESYKQSSRQ